MGKKNIDSLSFAYAYGCRNAGDFAINQGSLSLLNETVSNVEISAIARFAEKSEEFRRMAPKFNDIEGKAQLFGGPITYDPKTQSTPKQLLSLLENGGQYGFDLTGLAQDSRFHSDLFEHISGSDMFVFNGGNAIHYSPSHQSLPYLLAVLYPLHIARRSDVPYAILPQTIFGLEGVAKRIVVPILEDAEFVMTRDMKTFRYLSQFDLPTQVINGIDTAFLNGDPTVKTEESETHQNIAVVPRFSTLGDTDELDETGVQMEQTFFEYLETLIEDGHNVTLTIQTEIDRQWADENRDRLDKIGVDYHTEFDPESLRNHYLKQDLVVTMRLHAAIFALSMGTPTIGVYRSVWGPKLPGTFETLEIEEYAMSWDDVTLDVLMSVTEELLDKIEMMSETVASNVRMRNQQLVSDFKSAFHWIDEIKSV
jgi:polysaccharide pyruvyl transferase WcaK-like protein